MKTSQERAEERIRNAAADAMEELVRPLFTEPRRSQYLFTFIGRLPGDNEADILVTADDLSEIAALLDRSVKREPRP